LTSTTTTSAPAERAAPRPRDEADVAEIVAACSSALEPLGGGSKRAVGRPVDAAPLELGALRGIESYEPAELVLTAKAATPLHEIEQALAERAQRLAFDPPDFGALLGEAGIATIGGALATNLAGSRRVSAGAARDHFLGCTAVTGRGELFAAGGRVVKNVTGYDVPKLLAGSWGTLAILTRVTLRVVPAAETERTLIVRAATAEEAAAALSAALGSPHDVSSAAFDPELGCLLRLEGFAASVDARAAALRATFRGEVGSLESSASRALWREIGGAAVLAAWPVVWRISVPPADAPRVAAALGADRYLLDWGGGLIWAAFTGADAESARSAAERVRTAVRSGHATLFKAPREVRAAVPVFPPQPPVLAEAARRLKAAFDPADKLNPGRLG
jgi:glycolate oxidase FAD binding subunit